MSFCKLAVLLVLAGSQMIWAQKWIIMKVLDNSTGTPYQPRDGILNPRSVNRLVRHHTARGWSSWIQGMISAPTSMDHPSLVL